MCPTSGNKISVYTTPTIKTNMGKSYSSADIRQKLISILDNSETGMSGVEISEKTWY